MRPKSSDDDDIDRLIRESFREKDREQPPAPATKPNKEKPENPGHPTYLNGIAPTSAWRLSNTPADPAVLPGVPITLTQPEMVADYTKVVGACGMLLAAFGLLQSAIQSNTALRDSLAASSISMELADSHPELNVVPGKNRNAISALSSIEAFANAALKLLATCPTIDVRIEALTPTQVRDFIGLYQSNLQHAAKEPLQ